MSTKIPELTPAAAEAQPAAAVSRSNKATSPNGDGATLSLDELESRLKSSAAGLSQSEAGQRLTHYGYNELVEKE